MSHGVVTFFGANFSKSADPDLVNSALPAFYYLSLHPGQPMHSSFVKKRRPSLFLELWQMLNCKICYPAMAAIACPNLDWYFFVQSAY